MGTVSSERDILGYAKHDAHGRRSRTRRSTPEARSPLPASRTSAELCISTILGTARKPILEFVLWSDVLRHRHHCLPRSQAHCGFGWAMKRPASKFHLAGPTSPLLPGFTSLAMECFGAPRKRIFASSHSSSQRLQSQRGGVERTIRPGSYRPSRYATPPSTHRHI